MRHRLTANINVQVALKSAMIEIMIRKSWEDRPTRKKKSIF